MIYRIANILVLFMLSPHIYCQIEKMNEEEAFDRASKYHYTNKDSAYYYYEKTINLADKQDNLDYLFMGITYLIDSNGYFYDLENYRKNLFLKERLLQDEERLAGFQWTEYYKDYLLFNKGNYHYKTKEYTTSKRYFLELLHKLEELSISELYANDIEMMSSIYSFLGLIYQHTGKYEQAEYTYRKDIELVKKYADSIYDWRSSVASTKKLLSQVYEYQGKHNEAEELLQEALDYYANITKDPRVKNRYLSTSMLLAKNLSKQGKFLDAIDIIKESSLMYAEDNPFSREQKLVLGEAYVGLNRLEEALEEYSKGLDIYNTYRQHKPHQDIANAYVKIAELYLLKKNYREGFKNIQSAFNNSGNSISINTIHENPDPEKVFSKRQLLHLLDIKLQLLHKAKLETDGEGYLEAIKKTIQYMLRTFELLKKEFDSKVDKQFLAENVHPLFHRMLTVAFEVYTGNPTSANIQIALNISEKNKDFLLLEALRRTQATKYGDIPQSIRDKEVRLQAEIAYLEKEIFDKTKNDKSFSAELFELKKEYYNFLDTIKQKYPKYHNLKYKTTSLDLDVIREQILKEDETLISYTMTEQHLYVMVISRVGEKFLKLPFVDNDRKDIRDFYIQLSRPSISKDSNQLSALGNSLYNKILKEAIEGINAKDLIIIPDGELHYLPFDLLGDNNTYLLRTKSIGYGNSVTSLLELMQKRNSPKNKIFAFAPSFAGNTDAKEREFGKLLYNDNEILNISSFYNTEIVLDKDATLRRFLANMTDFNIFHLATHASANDAFPDYSYLAFVKENDSSSTNILYVKDLYNLSMNADMVTLSACQTGIGKLQQGQGMLSLSKGFYYAGAKSLVNTLWKINDKSTVNLMNYFYEELSKGKTKAEALRNAKLKYLETTDDELLRHPYYWAAFVVSGDISPLQGTISLWWFLLLIPVLMLLARYLAKKKSV